MAIQLDSQKEYDHLVYTLDGLRKLRDFHPIGSEIRNHYNSTCDRLDVLCSKISESHRIAHETKLRRIKL